MQEHNKYLQLALEMKIMIMGRIQHLPSLITKSKEPKKKKKQRID